MHTLKRMHKPLVINEIEGKWTEGSANGGRLFDPITVKYKIINRGLRIFYSSHNQKRRKSDVITELLNYHTLYYCTLFVKH